MSARIASELLANLATRKMPAQSCPALPSGSRLRDERLDRGGQPGFISDDSINAISAKAKITATIAALAHIAAALFWARRSILDRRRALACPRDCERR